MRKGYKSSRNRFPYLCRGARLLKNTSARYLPTGTDGFSVVHMKAPPGWRKPAQTPEFDVVTIGISGKIQAEMDEADVVQLQGGESFLAKKGSKVRYSNPFEETGECWSACMPDFEIEKANR